MMTSNVNDGVLQDQIMQFASCETQEALSQHFLLPTSQETPVLTDVATTDVDDQAGVRQQISALQIAPNFKPPQLCLNNKKKKKNRTSIEWTEDVLNLAVRVIYHQIVGHRSTQNDESDGDSRQGSESVCHEHGAPICCHH